MDNESTNENLSHVTTAIDNFSTQQMTPRQPVQDHQILSNYPQEDISSQYLPISFELVSELLDSNNNSYSVQNHAQPNNFHEFYFLKTEDKKCYKVTCVLISHSSIVEYLNKNIHGAAEFTHNEQQQAHYVEFSKELKENLEYYLKQFLASK